MSACGKRDAWVGIGRERGYDGERTGAVQPIVFSGLARLDESMRWDTFTMFEANRSCISEVPEEGAGVERCASGRRDDACRYRGRYRAAAGGWGLESDAASTQRAICGGPGPLHHVMCEDYAGVVAIAAIDAQWLKRWGSTVGV